MRGRLAGTATGHPAGTSAGFPPLEDAPAAAPSGDDRLPRAQSLPATARALTLSVRVVGAALLVTTGWIHLHLWLDGYRGIPWIGPLFLASAVLSGLAALAVLLVPPWWLPAVALLAGLLEIGTLGGLLLSLTVGLFGFSETTAAPLVRPTIAVEAAGFLVLAGYGAAQLWRSRRRALRASSWAG